MSAFVLQVDAAANCIAHYLRNQAGAVPGDMIGVLVLRSPLMVAALLGVLRAGCGYLPLDHHHPEARIDFMVEDATVKVSQHSQIS
jgi:non-ribosomal peptide synthetase component F